jgi:hypothetical protein
MGNGEGFVLGEWRVPIDEDTEFWLLCGKGEIELILSFEGFEGSEFWIEALRKFSSTFTGTVHGYMVEFARLEDGSKVVVRISAVTTEGDLAKAKVIDVEDWLRGRGLIPFISG